MIRHAFAAVALALVACSDNVSTDSATKDILTRGLEQHFNMAVIPDGQITILSPFESQMRSGDFDNGIYKNDFLARLKLYQSIGIVTIREHTQTELQAFGRMGAVTLTVTPTVLAREHANKDYQGTRHFGIKTGKVVIEDIVRDTTYTSLELPESEQYKLVLGTYRVIADPWWEKLTAEQIPPVTYSIFKFKALIKLDPFAKTYKFVKADYGIVNNEGWETNTIL